MGTAVAGQRLRLIRLSLLRRVTAPGVVLDRPGLDHAGRLHVVEELLALLGPQQGERPVPEGADASGGDVGVFGREVGAAGAALPGPGVRLLQRDLVVAAVLHPDLEDALDVHLDDVRPGQPVLRLEELAEDGVVERLRAQQADREGEAPGDLPGLARRHHRGGGGLAPHPDQCDALGPAGDRLGIGQWIGRVGVARAGRGQHVLLGAGHLGHRLPGRAVALEARDQGGVDHLVLEGPDEEGGDRGRRPARCPAPPDRSPGPARSGGRSLRPRRPCGAARTGGSQCRAPRCESAGTPGCTACSPSARGCNCRARRRRRRGTACTRHPRRCSRGRRRGRR